MNWAAIIWLVLLVIFIMTEASTVAVVSIWFAIGALAAMIASLLGAQVWLQVVLFLVVSCSLLCALRPLVRKYFTPKLTRTNVDSVIGSTGIVTSRIDNVMSQGQVKLGAMEWTARSTSGEVIEAGMLVKADRIEGVKVFVTPAEVSANVK
ncbi:MAG: NfeD family protein [Oscillospiraceae bacterium]|nr:NfeD family protein [Oscillospiraceae bacterium]